MAAKILDQSPTVEADHGCVFVEAPGIRATMTPEAALEASDRLFNEAAMAIGERKMPGSE